MRLRRRREAGGRGRSPGERAGDGRGREAGTRRRAGAGRGLLSSAGELSHQQGQSGIRALELFLSLVSPPCFIGCLQTVVLFPLAATQWFAFPTLLLPFLLLSPSALYLLPPLAAPSKRTSRDTVEIQNADNCELLSNQHFLNSLLGLGREEEGETSSEEEGEEVRGGRRGRNGQQIELK